MESTDYLECFEKPRVLQKSLIKEGFEKPVILINPECFRGE